MSFEEDQFNYDVVNDTSITHRFSQKDIEKLQTKGLEFNTDTRSDDDEPEITKENDELYYKNLFSSPYPLNDGIFANVCSFKERTKYMEAVVENKVYKTLMKPGSGEKVFIDAALMFHMNAFILESYDEPFDSTFARKKPLLCRLNQTISGLATSLLTMQVGERSEFAVHRSLAYGDLGCPPRIPPGSDIIFIIELLHLYPRGSIQYYHALTADEQRDEGLTIEQVILLANNDRKEGNENFHKKDYLKAIHFYRRAINLLEKFSINQEDKQTFHSMLLTLYRNTASVHIRLSNGPQIIHFARRAQHIDEDSVKTNYQLGIGYLKLGKYDKSKKYLLKAHQCLPNDEFINQALEVLNHKLTVFRMESKDLYKKMSQAFIR